MIRYIQTYNDPIKTEIHRLLKRLDFLNTIPIDIYTQLIFKVPLKQYNKKTLVFKPGDPMNTI
jgi:hypothetical protein